MGSMPLLMRTPFFTADNISVTPTSTNDQTIAGSASLSQEYDTFGYVERATSL